MPFLPFRKMPWHSPLRTTYAGIDGQHDDRDIGKLAALEHPDQWGDIGQRRGPDPGPHEEFRTVSLDVVNKLSPRLFGSGEIFSVRRPCHFHIYRPFGDLSYRLPDDIHRREQFP